MKIVTQPIDAIIKTQLNIDKFTPQQKQTFIECLQRSIANERSKANGRRCENLPNLQQRSQPS